jgi:PGF-CTERM protein
MDKKTAVILLLLTSVILAGAPESFARPQYLTNLTAVYGSGSCGTCHVITSSGGQRDFNGTFGQHNFSNDTSERRDPNRTFAARSSNGTFRQRNSNRTLPLNSYGTLFENQPDHAADPSAALVAIGQPPTSAPTDTAVPATGAQASPGFGFVAALVGLFACALLARRHNK